MVIVCILAFARNAKEDASNFNADNLYLLTC